MSRTATEILQDSPAGVSQAFRENRGWLLFCGIALLLLGVAAIVFPFVATLAAELMIGWILLISGFVGLINASRNAKWPGFSFSLLAALLSIAIGILLLAFPLTGMLTLTLLITALFVAGGVLRIALAVRLRPLDHWGWMLASGVLSLLLAVVIISQWPQAAAWVIGLVVGVDLVFAGAILIMLASAAYRPA
jgi:uncharacterized membrane protein HdeD (DUF308 family)